MNLQFNWRGFLHQTITLTYEEFVSHFGTNPQRMEQIENALRYCRIFYSCGCLVVYIDGSFVSTKKYPEDIDLLFDITDIEEDKIKREFPQLFDVNEIGRIRRDKKCHIFTFTKTRTRLLDLLSADREEYPKGFVLLNLKDMPIL